MRKSICIVAASFRMGGSRLRLAPEGNVRFLKEFTESLDSSALQPGLVPPLQFIPFAEQTGFVRRLTDS